MNTPVLEFHISDGALVRYLDGACDADDCVQTEAHLAGCAPCAAHLAMLRHRSAALSQLLADADAAVPAFHAVRPEAAGLDLSAARRRRAARRGASTPPWLRIAAAMVLLLAGGVAASPLRARIVDWVRELWTQSEPRPTVPATPVPGIASQPQAAPADAGTRVRFTPTGPDLIVEVPAGASTGTLTLAVVAGSSAEVQIAGSGKVLVLPGWVRITTSAADADRSPLAVRVNVPATLRNVEIRAGDRTAESFSPGAIGAGGTREVRQSGGG